MLAFLSASSSETAGLSRGDPAFSPRSEGGGKQQQKNNLLISQLDLRLARGLTVLWSQPTFTPIQMIQSVLESVQSQPSELTFHHPDANGQ